MVPGPGQVFVTGDVTRFVADDAQLATPLASPLTLTATERGVGGATIDNAVVGGKRSTISWGAGTPLPITGTGGLDLGPVHVEAGSAGITWTLDGRPRPFVPGVYHAGAPVAVGTVGIATSRDAVDFTADAQTVLTSRRGVVVYLDLRPIQLTGPGHVSVSGRLRVQTPDTTRPVANVAFGPGPFKVTLIPGAGGVAITSVLQGTFTAS